jgi:hypothetical protein
MFPPVLTSAYLAQQAIAATSAASGSRLGSRGGSRGKVAVEVRFLLSLVRCRARELTHTILQGSLYSDESDSDSDDEGSLIEERFLDPNSPEAISMRVEAYSQHLSPLARSLLPKCQHILRDATSFRGSFSSFSFFSRSPG